MGTCDCCQLPLCSARQPSRTRNACPPWAPDKPTFNRKFFRPHPEICASQSVCGAAYSMPPSFHRTKSRDCSRAKWWQPTPAECDTIEIAPWIRAPSLPANCAPGQIAPRRRERSRLSGRIDPPDDPCAHGKLSMQIGILGMLHVRTRPHPALADSTMGAPSPLQVPGRSDINGCTACLGGAVFTRGESRTDAGVVPDYVPPP